MTKSRQRSDKDILWDINWTYIGQIMDMDKNLDKLWGSYSGMEHHILMKLFLGTS